MNKNKTNNDFKIETTRKHFRFNRYLVLRYMLAMFFFTNLYWLLAMLLSGASLWLVPGALILLSIGAISEHVKMYSDKTAVEGRGKLAWNFVYHVCQLTLNIGLAIVCLFQFGFNDFYPFVSNNSQSQQILLTGLMIGSLISLFCLRRISLIRTNSDKYYQYIKEFEKTF